MSISATVTSQQPITATIAASGVVSANVPATANVQASVSGGVGPQGPVGATGASGQGGSLAWSEITGKPTTFPPSSHSHSLLDITGLQNALDGKQASGSYALASHQHAASDVSGLAAVATSGSYADLINKPTIPAAVTSLPASSITGLALVATTGAYGSLVGTPSTFAPSAHAASHATGGADPITITSAQVSDFTAAAAAAAPATTNASLLTSGTLASARLSANVVLTNDARLSDARTPITHTHAATAITSGTLDDARLSFTPIHPFLLMGG